MPTPSRSTTAKGKVLRVHRGLTFLDLPGRDNEAKRFTFPLFERGLYPPPAWRIPASLEGEELRLALAEGARKSVIRRPLHLTKPSPEPSAE